MNWNNKKTITIDGRFYTISSTLMNDTWKIMLTNLTDLFVEKLSGQEIVERCERLNPLLSIEDIDANEIICKLFDNIPKYVVEPSSLNEIKLQTVIDGGTFKFIINLNRADDDEFREEIMQPVTFYVDELHRKFSDLIEEVKRKDEEILEYKANGAKLIRKHIETKPFNPCLWLPDRFKQYEELMSMCQSVSNNNKRIELQENIKMETTEMINSSNHFVNKDKKRKLFNSNS